MKKILSIILINIFFSVLIFAQEETEATSSTSGRLTNKKGTPILPASGDIALGADAIPIFRYIGNIFSGYTGQNSLSMNDMDIYGRYFLTSDACVRFNLYVDNGIYVSRFYIQDDAAVLADPLSQDKVVDKRTQKYNDWMLSVGYQKFRGYGRLKGFYGATIGYGQYRTQYEYQYGNEMTIANQNPTTVTNWGNGANSPQASRNLTQDNGLSRNISLGPVAGVEFYFAPKMCVGAEVNLLYSVNMSTESDYTYQEWANGGINEVVVESTPGNLSRNLSSSGLGAYGGLYVMFHF